MFRTLGKIVSRHPIWFLVIWPVLGAAIILTSPKLGDVADKSGGTELPSYCESSRTNAELARDFQGYDAENSSLVVILSRAGGLKGEDDSQVKFVTDWLRRQTREEQENGKIVKKPTVNEEVLNTTTAPYLADRLKSADGTSTMIAARLRVGWLDEDAQDLVSRLAKELDARLQGTGLTYAMTGSAVVGQDYEGAIQTSLHRTEIVTYIMVVAILILICRSPLAAVVPLATIVLSLKVAEAVAGQAASHGVMVPSLAPTFMMVVMFGAGTNYCLFLVGRYKEELGHGRDYPEAMSSAVTHVGRALEASAATEILGLCLMAFASFQILSRTGVAVGLSLIVALVAALTLAPALFVVTASKGFWPRKADTPLSGAFSRRMWRRLALVVCKRPGAVLIVLIVAATPFAYFGATMRPSYDLFKELPQDSLSVRGQEALLDKFGGNSRPEQLTVVITTSNDLTTPEAQLAVLKLVRGISGMTDVAEVRSLVSPTGEFIANIDSYLGRQAQHSIWGWNPIDESILKRSAAVYVGKDNHATKIDIVLKNDIFAPQSMDLVAPMRAELSRMVRESGLAKGETLVGGLTAHMSDLREVIRIDLHRLMMLVSVVVFLLLVWLMKDWFSPIYMLGTMGLSYLTTLGITDLFFRHVVGVPGLDWKIQFFLFVLLVAIGEDYNIYLMSRVREESARHSVRQAFRRGIVFTGAIISSCGIIMAGTFASLMWGHVAVMVQMGFAMAVGILLDTFLVRPVLLPAVALAFPVSTPGDGRI